MSTKNLSFRFLDVFAEAPQFKFSTTQHRIHLNIGSIFSLLCFGTMAAFTYTELHAMFLHERKTYITSNYALDLDELGEIFAKDYNETFQFTLYIQTQVPDFDILDNKNVEFKAYEVTEYPDGWSTRINQELQMRRCNKDELAIMFGEWGELNYESICFDGESNIKFKANWMNHKKYTIPQMTMIECQDSKNKKCASKDEIEDFVKNSMIGALIFRTVTHENIYEKDSKFFTYQNGTKQYVPIQVMPQRIYDQVIKDYSRESGWVNVQTIFMGIDQYIFDDSFLQISHDTIKSFKFMNLKRWTSHIYNKAFYVHQDSHPIIVFEFNLHNQSQLTRRTALALSEVLAQVGGISRIIIPVFLMMYQVTTKDLYEATVMLNLSNKVSDIKNARKFQSNQFQIKLFFYRRIDFVSKYLAKKCFNNEFLHQVNDFDKLKGRISENLSIVYMVQKRAQYLQLVKSLFQKLYKIQQNEPEVKEQFKKELQELDDCLDSHEDLLQQKLELDIKYSHRQMQMQETRRQQEQRREDTFDYINPNPNPTLQKNLDRSIALESYQKPRKKQENITISKTISKNDYNEDEEWNISVKLKR